MYMYEALRYFVRLRLIASRPSAMQWTLAWQPYTQKIILHCLIVTTPMLVSSIAILYIVYTNLITPTCALQELCQASEVVNVTSKAFYYIDFSAAQLAFVSSWSATVSFALVGFLMAFASYANASSLLHASEKDDQDDLPSPHQMSVLLRVLNAEMMILWDLASSKVKRVFWHREKESEDVQHTSPILGASVIILLLSLLARYNSSRHWYRVITIVGTNVLQPPHSSG